MPTTADDRAAIEELLVRYAHRCDQRDFAGAGRCFTDDARAEYSGVRLPPGVAHIVAHLAGLAALPATQHVVGSISVEVTGDEAAASSYAVAHLVRAVGGAPTAGNQAGSAPTAGNQAGGAPTAGDSDGVGSGREPGGGHEVVHRGLVYDDHLVRTPDGWRIAWRRHRVLWSTTEPTRWPVPPFRAG